jgi:dTDP-4-amino-4,6-dideoxygalactose transaminase
MLRKLPVIGHPIGALDLLAALFSRNTPEGFLSQLKAMFSTRYLYLTNTGIASFYLVLLTLKKISKKTEVILPCYTAPSLVVAVRKAGLKPVFCDITLADFNADTEDLLRRVNDQTLCVVAVHMFGIPYGAVATLRERLPKGVFLVEDCAQAFGSKIKEAFVGTFGDFSFCSFGRGKNLSTYEGGCVLTSSGALAQGLERELAFLPKPGLATELKLGIKFAAFALVCRPFWYGLLHPLAARFKDNSVPSGFDVNRMADFTTAVGARLLKKAPRFFTRRQENGLCLLEALAGVEGLLLPNPSLGTTPVYNRLPVVVKEKDRLDKIVKELEAYGIESSGLYGKPLHHIFDLGYNKDEFPNAVYFAERLLTLPVHPFVLESDIATMAKVIRRVG